MNIIQVSSALNLFGLATPLVFSLFIARVHARPFFLWWTGSYAAYLIAVFLIVLHTAETRPLWLAAVTVACYHAGGVALQQVARLWHNRAARPKFGWLQAAVLAAGFTTLLATANLELAVTPSALLTVAAHLQLGWVMGRGQATGLHRLLAGSIALTGLWILVFPVLGPTPWAWVGYLVAGVLHMLVGLAMVVSLLEDVAAELAAKNQELAASDAAKTAFVSTVSHEVRTPTTVLKTGLWLLHHQRDQLPPALQAQVIADMLASADRLERLAANVLDVAKQDIGVANLLLREACLEEVVEAGRPMFELMAQQRDVQLVLDAHGSTPVEMDTDAMTHVLSNLVDNALRHTPPGGKVVLAVRRIDGAARLEVSDTGCGVPPDMQARIFERFVQGPRARAGGGAGLGLWLCRHIVARHGGVIGVESAPDERPGATFWVTLPLVPPTSPTEDALAPAAWAATSATALPAPGPV
jgi:signal transduction histidine kinase